MLKEGLYMKTRISRLWKVPVFCLAAGFLSFYANVFLVSRFAVVQLPDGSLTANPTLTTLFSALFLILSLVLGNHLLRNMTPKERFLSALIQVVFLLVSLPSAMLSTYATEWSRLIDRIVFAMTDNIYLTAILSCFAPLLLVPSRKKK